MSISIVVPFRPDGAERDRNWAWLRAHYETLYPDWELVVAQDTEGPWCKSKLVNEAVRRSSGDRLVVSDADMYLDDAVMREGVRRLKDSPWVVPHRRAYRLNPKASEDFIAGKLRADNLTHDHIELPPRNMYPCGGVFFTTRDAYEKVGGFDERFVGWGGEDESLGLAYQVLYGPPVCLEAELVHLWHQPQPEMPADRSRPPHADALVKTYEAKLAAA